MGVAQKAMVGSVQKLRMFAKGMLQSRPDLNPIGRQDRVVLDSSIPQAQVIETKLQSYEAKNWREHFAAQLSGRGLEIGPLHRPMCKHDKMTVDYIDRCTIEELREHYPELAELPLVEPDIIGDGETLETIPDAVYDFLISAHVIEHTKNPIGSLEQWCRVLVPGGKIYLIVPDKRAIFDHKRVRTTLPHMILDYLRPSEARDYEHYLDYAIHVHDKGGSEAVAEADRLKETDYSIHFHVFLPSDVKALLEWFSENVRPIEILEGPVMSPGSDEFHFLLEVR